MRHFLWVCLITLFFDCLTTEIWLDIRPWGHTPPRETAQTQHFLPRCSLVDGDGLDFAFVWKRGNPHCINLREGQWRL